MMREYRLLPMAPPTKTPRFPFSNAILIDNFLTAKYSDILANLAKAVARFEAAEQRYENAVPPEGVQT